MQRNAGLRTLLVELAPFQKSSNDGMVSIHSVQTSVTFQTLKSAGLSQSQKRRNLGAVIGSRDRLKRLSAGLCQRESD